MLIGSGDDLAKMLMRMTASCRRCGQEIAFEEGAQLAMANGIKAKVVMCRKCRSIFEVDINPTGLTLRADVTKRYAKAAQRSRPASHQSGAAGTSGSLFRAPGRGGFGLRGLLQVMLCAAGGLALSALAGLVASLVRLYWGVASAVVFTILFSLCLPAVINFRLAGKRGRHRAGWTLFGLLGSYLSTMLLLFLGPKQTPADGALPSVHEVEPRGIDMEKMNMEENVYFDKAGIKVTNDLVTTNAAIYKISDLVSVEAVKGRYGLRRKDRPGKVYPVWWLVMMTPIYALMGAAGLVGGLLSGTLSFLAVGVLASLAFIVFLRTTLKGLNWTYYVRLKMRHGEQPWAFDSTDGRLVNSVVDAVRQAIKAAEA